jgi:P pilus assembly chaperone PapD
MQAGTSKYIVTRVKNTGQVTWQRETTRLATANPQDRTSAFKDATWMSGNRVVRMNEATVAPGATATFEYWYKAPAQAKAYTEDFTVVIEGKSWIPYFGIRHNTTVTP